MRSPVAPASFLTPAIVLLALAAGVIHLLVMVQLFVLSPGGPPGGGPPPVGGRASVNVATAAASTTGGQPAAQPGSAAPATAAGATTAGRAGPPLGGSPSGGNALMAHLPQLFVLNFLGFTALAALFLLVRRFASRYLLLVDALLGLMAVATLVGWSSFGHPNPHGLGAVALVVELCLLAAVLAHAVATRAPRPQAALPR